MIEEIEEIFYKNSSGSNHGHRILDEHEWNQCAHEICQLVCDKMVKALSFKFRGKIIIMTSEENKLQVAGFTKEQINRSLERLKQK